MELTTENAENAENAEIAQTSSLLPKTPSKREKLAHSITSPTPTSGGFGDVDLEREDGCGRPYPQGKGGGRLIHTTLVRGGQLDVKLAIAAQTQGMEQTKRALGTLAAASRTYRENLELLDRKSVV